MPRIYGNGSWWTHERFEQLKLLVEKGLSARDIAIEFGGITRNAVIGKMHRNGLMSANPPCIPNPRAPRAMRNGGSVLSSIKARQKQERAITAGVTDNRCKAAVLARATALGELPAREVVALPPEPGHADAVALLDLQHNDCRWPIDGPDDTAAQRRFCGCERMHWQTPYCARHHALAYVPFKQRAERKEVLWPF